MQTKIDIKSMVLGAVLGAVIMLSVGAATTQDSSTGRYHLVVADGYAYKIDSHTGQVWASGGSSLTKEFKAPVAQ